MHNQSTRELQREGFSVLEVPVGLSLPKAIAWTAAEGLVQGDRLLTLYGGMNSDDREAVKAAFQTHPMCLQSGFCSRSMRLPKVWIYKTFVSA